jgi:hypothetical protein
MITEDYVNICKPYKHEYQKYSTFDKKTKASVELMLSYIKKNRIIINENLLTDKQKEIILDIYNEDIIFINNLEEKFSYF